MKICIFNNYEDHGNVPFELTGTGNKFYLKQIIVKNQTEIV